MLLNKYTACLFLLLSICPVLVYAQSVRVNEFMALNANSIMDEDGDYSDWIELVNDSTATINIQGWALTDDADDTQKWLFPDMTIAPGQYLVVFASGKDRIDADKELHTNFKLSGDGEYLALYNGLGNIVTEFSPGFPAQVQDVSFAYFDGNFLATLIPTPGEENILSNFQLLQEPRLSHEHGIYDTPFDLEISTDLSGVQIYYTTNGDIPDSKSGRLYSGPVLIDSTTVLRAIIIKSDTLKSKVVTCTYLFLHDIINQPNDPEGYPAEWGPYHAIEGTAIADYEMDPEITQDPQWADVMDEALLALPIMSIVTRKGNLFSHALDPDTGGIYIYTGDADDRTPEQGGAEGGGWERPASVEYFTVDGSKSFQMDCGLRIHGGHSRRPEKTPKHSFRLVFRSEYGSTRLNFPLFDNGSTESFNTVVLRAGFGNTMTHHSHSERTKIQYIRDQWAKQTQLDMGHPAGHGGYVHLYLNGIYWGIYNPTERLDGDFAQAYYGGEEGNFDIIKDYEEVVAGNRDAWITMKSIANAGLSDNANFQKIQGNNPDGTRNPDYPVYLDVVNFIDYMLINYFGTNWDWDNHNWAAIRDRTNPDKGFQFYSWDTEHIIEQIDANNLELNNAGKPTGLFNLLIQNEDFKRLFTDRVQLFFFNGGMLTPQKNIERWMKFANQVEPAIIAEVARWGDYRRDVHPYQTAGPFDLYGKQYWTDQLNFIINDYFPQRGDVFIDQLKAAGLFPNTVAPSFLINGEKITENIISSGDVLSMVTTAGDIYYTTNGNDVIAANSGEQPESYTLINPDNDKRVYIPDGNISSSWYSDLNFDDSGWMLCEGAPGGVGYEKDSGYEDLISLDVSNMADGENPNTSCYIRILFNTDSVDLAELQNLQLRVLYDDGFRAYLNGLRILERNAPASPGWDLEATQGHEAHSYETFDITDKISRLKKGENLLAIQGLNYGISSSDFLINVKLTGSNMTVTEGTLSPDARVYTDPIELKHTTQIKARTIQGGEWSALSEKIFSVPGEISALKMTEINYHPLADDFIGDQEFEFIELKNTGESALDLSGFRFVDGISYTFPDRTVLNSGAFIVLASNPAQFLKRYGFYAEAYDGNLNNGGEQITGISASGDTIINITYDDTVPWPSGADGQGYSLVPVENNPKGDQNNPAGWQASAGVNGSPGKDDPSSTDIKDEPVKPVSGFYLAQNYPNPFNPATIISWQLAVRSHVELDIYNILGQKIVVLLSEEQKAGHHQFEWNAEGMASGIYFYRLKVNNKIIKTRKMMLLR